MKVETAFGKVNINSIEPYGESSYILGYIKEPNDCSEYTMLGIDVPVEDDPVWRFWVEEGFADGSAQTHDAELSEEDKLVIKYWIKEKHPEIKIFWSWDIYFFNVKEDRYDEIEFDAYTAKEAIKLFEDWCVQDEKLSKPYEIEEIFQIIYNEN